MSRPTSLRAHKTYVLWLTLVWLGVVQLVLLTNTLIDPLWHVRGNVLTHKNFAFNERQAKLNQLLRHPEQYNCLIFGSSRTTLLPPGGFLPYRCFNLAFSGGQIEEFIAYATYLKARGMRPALIVVGVDGFNFQATGRDPLSIPGYIARHQAPPGWLKDYLSADSLRMSWRTLRNDSPLPRYYDAQFSPVIQADAPRFQPQITLEGEGLRRADAGARRIIQYQPDNATLYKKLIALFPYAQAIGYVPPISAWHVADMEKHGVLPGYLGALHTTAAHFPVFIDFSIPSRVTARTDNTYDGSHYLPSVNHSIARSLLTGVPQEWGIPPQTLRLDTYRLQYQIALDQFQQSAAPTQNSRGK